MKKLRTFLTYFAVMSVTILPFISFGQKSASAVPIDTALGVVIDGSGSIVPGDFQTQINAYDAILGNASIVPANGSVVVSVIQFSGAVQVEQTAIRLSSESDRTTLLNSINNMIQLGGATNIGGGIELARTDMDPLLASINVLEFDVDFKKLIDVSTDGIHNTGLDPTVATQDALDAGYSSVNALGIGALADLTWNLAGLDFVAPSFEELEDILEDKIRQEIGTVVPEPTTVALLGIGLVGLAGAEVRRRRKKKAVDKS